MYMLLPTRSHLTGILADLARSQHVIYNADLLSTHRYSCITFANDRESAMSNARDCRPEKTANAFDESMNIWPLHCQRQSINSLT